MVGIAQRYQLTATGRWDRILKRAGPTSHDAATTGQGRHRDDRSDLME